MADNIFDRIRERAYQIWESLGHPQGDHDDHWLQAEREILGKDAAPPDSFSHEAAGRDAARDYDRDVKKFSESGQVDAKVKEAERALDGPEREELRRAEEAGKRRSKNAA
ncbi:MAG TPA: DUF2934 domain-containing protein [Candidatus Binataceae bacterium]|nr:DUF2934 domain-containing protein [Candidatus Binataceae bacterium]